MVAKTWARWGFIIAIMDPSKVNKTHNPRPSLAGMFDCTKLRRGRRLMVTLEDLLITSSVTITVAFLVEPNMCKGARIKLPIIRTNASFMHPIIYR